jgi:hypothetical protein
MSETQTIDVLETLEPAAQTYEVILGDRVFEQTPLSFFRKIELFSVLADAIDKALSEGALVSEFLEDIPDSSSNISDSDVFVKAVVKIVKHAPDLLRDITCISLNVKRGEREEVLALLEDIDDEQAMLILNHFVDQNWDAMQDFFSKQMMPLVGKVSEKLQSQSTLSKPSKASRPRTPKK